LKIVIVRRDECSPSL